MKAGEVLRRYAAGERDFRRVNLRGQSFKGQDLSGADFSNADIRSADFTDANLFRANFTGAKAGLRRRWAIFIVMISWFILGISGFIYLYNGRSIPQIFDVSKIENLSSGLVTIVGTIIIFFIILWQGIKIPVVSTVIVLSTVTGVIFATVNIGIAFAAAPIINFSFAVLLASLMTGVRLVAGDKAFLVAFLITLPGGFIVRAIVEAEAPTTGSVTAGFLTVVTVIIITYIAYQAVKEDKKYTLIRNIAVVFAAFGGTSFRDADLTNANFAFARLKSTDLRGAKLTRTCFNKTKLLNHVRPGTSYLQHPSIRQLLTTRQGQNKNFDRMNLRGINLKGAFLTDASFIGADLIGANLQDANLSRAKLVKTQLDSTDFTGANLTGAYIEDWSITTDTNFDRVLCDYVYMRLPTKENPEPWRKPDNKEEVFADGEFGDFIKPLVDTLDLYHKQDVDPRAISISFNKLAENHPDAKLQIVAMEKRGEDKFLLRAKTALLADKSQLSAEYFEIYNHAKALAEKEVKALILEKDSRIRSLENFVNIALQRSIFYSNTSVEKVDNMIDQSGGISQNMSSGKMYGGMQAAQGDGSHQNMDTNVVSSEQKQTLAEAAAEVQQLLYQLSQTNSRTTEEVTEAIHQEIRRNPTLKARLKGALQAGGLEALKAIFNHPLFSIPAETVKGWLEAE